MSAKEPEGGNGGVFRYRVDHHSRQLDRFEEWRVKVDEDRTSVRGDLKQLHLDNIEMRSEMTGVRRVLVALLSTIAASTVVFSLSILLATGKL